MINRDARYFTILCCPIPCNIVVYSIKLDEKLLNQNTNEMQTYYKMLCAFFLALGWMFLCFTNSHFSRALIQTHSIYSIVRRAQKVRYIALNSISFEI